MRCVHVEHAGRVEDPPASVVIQSVLVDFSQCAVGALSEIEKVNGGFSAVSGVFPGRIEEFCAGASEVGGAGTNFFLVTDDGNGSCGQEAGEELEVIWDECGNEGFAALVVLWK